MKRHKDAVTTEIFGDPTGRGDGWRSKGKASEFDRTLARRAGMTLQHFLEDRRMRRARSHRWLKRFERRVAATIRS